MEKIENAGCLVIHGFGGDIREVESLVEGLREVGYRVLAPALEGHTGKRSDMRRAGYRDWISSAEAELCTLEKSCQKVHVIGFSMGGLIAANLVLRHKAASMVTINTPIYYWNIRRILLNILDDFRQREIRHTRRYVRASGVPLSALINFKLLLHKTKKLLEDVTCPLLVLQATNDDTVRRCSAEYIYRNIGSANKKIRYFESGRHVILRGPEAKGVIEEVLSFLRQFQ